MSAAAVTDLLELTAAEVAGDDASAARAVKLLRLAIELGWTENPYTSLVVRLKHPDGEPMFARWDMAIGANGKASWRFKGARAANGQPLTLNDAFAVLEHPELIYPEPPADLKEEESGNDCNDA